jgi:hypothetical protein
LQIHSFLRCCLTWSGLAIWVESAVFSIDSPLTALLALLVAEAWSPVSGD